MFVYYIPDESTSLCYAVGVLSCLSKIPACVVKVKPKRLCRFRGVCVFIFFSMSVNFRMTCLHHNRICVAQVGRILCSYCLCISMFEFDFSTKRVYVLRISCKDLKSMLGQVNYRVPNMRFLREKFPVNFYLSNTLLSQSISLLFSPFSMILSESVDL